MDTNGEVNMCCNSIDKINSLNILKIICFLSLLFLSVHAADDSLLFSEQETGEYFYYSINEIV